MSYHKRKEEEPVDPGSVILVLFLLLFIVVLIIVAIINGVRTVRFDNAFKTGKVTFNTNYIPLGSQGSPATGSLPVWMPGFSESLIESPRLYEITKCEALTLPENATGVYAMTPYFSPEVIQISVPTLPSGSVNVCVSEGIEIQVVLWAKSQ